MPFLATDLEARPASLPVMASDGDCGKRPWGGSPSHDSCNIDPRLLIGVGLLLLQAWWQHW
jgi:hypothetical protein